MRSHGGRRHSEARLSKFDNNAFHGKTLFYGLCAPSNEQRAPPKGLRALSKKQRALSKRVSPTSKPERATSYRLCAQCKCRARAFKLQARRWPGRRAHSKFVSLTFKILGRTSKAQRAQPKNLGRTSKAQRAQSKRR